ncbi:MAG: enoyl-CoA hydratase/isomerase family protein [Candidatus Marinimicrobia bacterium]|jgi:enoyl-CoA hydratase|nr:enoyl-CoA hydratase/isomerase family protein [Candidatus Neomarinimicrobiota bacterium]MBT3502288.1 enoyl-CoA hydratase/isomerase family protein [Candidatus Neomarinimicrobiota bacterium]MBT3840366.1 enoyl-CoA hydratase/isomerase family protein [Candidatus Neomarinimicrobiota bacterium]MBT5460350.1 enoyl-CoA hydratase/isomerase family protein [Candidatus Neomarinimicrobiota bacterium]MBT6863676.1 enoyl-CoA hydratase/isomerase family protein [Candidatus Neomarinimicrobiota bacterium]
MNYIKSDIQNRVGILTIDRPDALNAMNPDVFRELSQSLNNMILNEDVGVIVLTGAGEKAFIAGADIKLMQQLDLDGAQDFGKLGQDLTLTIENSPKPVIAAINGFALGGGCEISLACHIRFASENAMFSQPEVKLGLIPGWGGTQRLSRIVGKGIAMELIIGGQMINAEEANRIGLVNKVFPLDQLLNETIKFANLILQNGPNSVAKSLECINFSSGNTLKDGLNLEVETFTQLFDTEETSEGLTAFVEKRKPNFR